MKAWCPQFLPPLGVFFFFLVLAPLLASLPFLAPLLARPSLASLPRGLVELHLEKLGGAAFGRRGVPATGGAAEVPVPRPGLGNGWETWTGMGRWDGLKQHG